MAADLSTNNGMENEGYRCLTISDFNLGPFAGYLNNDPESPRLRTIVTPFGQVMQTLLDGSSEFWRSNPALAIVWTQPHSIIGSFYDLLNYQQVSTEVILGEVEHYASVLKNIKDRVSDVFVPAWVVPPHYNSWGMMDMKRNGAARTLMKMNLRLSEVLEQTPNIHVLNTSKWIEMVGKNSFNPKLWYMAKVAFGNEIFKEAVKDIKAALRGIRGTAKKVIVLDLDDTLWGGIVGDLGWENIVIGGHDPVGEAHADFQLALQSLANRGIVLAIVSKNEESVALEAIKNHPEMKLRLKDFAGWKINWNDKAQNVVNLASELNVGIDSMVFIDDNPVERARVREALPEVFVPEWPKDKMLYRKALFSLSCFDVPSFSEEDFQRAKLYQAERQRVTLKNDACSIDDWLMTLGMSVEIEEFNTSNRARVTQLLNKTNQMNLSTRRMAEAELESWTSCRGHKLWVFRVSDKFGDAGLTGIVSIEEEEKKVRVVDFILSCRVMGRKVEETMLHKAIAYAQSRGMDEVYAKYISTPKNKPCFEFWRNSGCSYTQANNTFHWPASRAYPPPKQIKLSAFCMKQSS